MKKLPLFVALDVKSRHRALDLVRQSRDYAQGVKIGPRLFLACGPSLIQEIKALEPLEIFLDFKFFDIPSSTLEAVRSAFHAGADLVTVHGIVGDESLKLLSEFEKSVRKKRPFRILFVTVLSSEKSQKDTISRTKAVASRVWRAGLKGLVCSPWEVEALRRQYKDAFLLSPGIRFAGEDLGDQKRVMGPLEALRKGSSALVMGRSLIKAKDPEGALKRLQKEWMAEAKRL